MPERPDLREAVFKRLDILGVKRPPFFLIGIRDESNLDKELWNDLVGYVKHESLWLTSGTTDPGKYYQDNPMNVKGCAHIASNMFFDKCYMIGNHGSGAFKHEAFVQVRPMIVVRAKSIIDYLDGKTEVDNGIFATNFHSSPTHYEKVGRTSAGCTVVEWMKDLVHILDMFRTTDEYKFDPTAKVGYIILNKEELK